MAYNASGPALAVLTWLMSTCILTCLWNIAGAVDAPRLYSSRNEVGEVTLCCKSVI